MLRGFLPLAVFAALAGLLYVGLGIDPKKVPSPLIDKPAPEFDLALLKDEGQRMNNDVFKGQVSLMNVWATWCVSCKAEHQVLMAMQKAGVKIYGLNYKDDRTDAKRWLKFYGNPYIANGFDPDGRAGIDWGVYGTPETFVVDHKGVIRHKHIGPIGGGDVAGLMDIIRKLEAEAAQS